MERDRNRDVGLVAEERLEILNNRLVSSTYMEDKIETLENIYEYALKMPVTVGTICLSTIYRSLEETEEPESQLRIIDVIITAGHRNEFTEMLFEDRQNIDVLYRLELGVIVRLSGIFKSKYFFEKISGHDECANLVRKLVDGDMEECAGYFIAENGALKDRLVFGGIMEALIGKYKKPRKNAKHRKSIETLLSLILEDSLISQNYMFENKLHFALLSCDASSDGWVLSILSQLLNPNNVKFRDIQKSLFIPRQIHRAVEQKNYEFLYRLTLDHPANIRCLLLKYLNRDILVEDTEKLRSALLLFSAYVEYCSPEGICSDSYKINIILEEHGLGQSLHQKVLGDLGSGKVTPEMLLYILFVFDSLDQVEESLRSIQMDGICDGLRTILFLMHSRIEPVDSGYYLAIKQLGLFRGCLCSSALINEHFDGILISNVTELIEELGETHRSMVKSQVWPDAEAADSRMIGPGVDVGPLEQDFINQAKQGLENSSEKSTVGFSERLNSIVGTSGYKKIADTFRIFKQENNDSDVYDL